MTGYPFRADCVRPGCGHSSDRHGFDDAQDVGVTDPKARFRCQVCGPDVCPDMQRSAQNIADIEAVAMED